MIIKFPQRTEQWTENLWVGYKIMKSVQPCKKDICDLLQFLPLFCTKGFTPVAEEVSSEVKDGVMSFPWVKYRPEVEKFIYLASKECWCDYEYVSGKAREMLNDEMMIKHSSLDDLKTMLTYCIRGDRFCDGHIGSIIESGKIKLILTRLKQIYSQKFD